MKKQLHNYALLCAEEKTIKAKKASLKKKLEEEFGQEESLQETEWGNFKMVKNVTYKYSDTLTKLEEDIAILREDEKENGTAVPNTSYGLRFNSK